MTELVELERSHQEFAKRNTRVVVSSLEDQATAQETQAQFPHLVVVADKEGNLSQQLQLIHPESAIDGGDTSAPTTVLIDGQGVVRWTFRPDRFLTRLSPAQVLAAIDEHIPVRQARSAM